MWIEGEIFWTYMQTFWNVYIKCTWRIKLQKFVYLQINVWLQNDKIIDNILFSVKHFDVQTQTAVF